MPKSVGGSGGRGRGKSAGQGDAAGARDLRMFVVRCLAAESPQGVKAETVGETIMLNLIQKAYEGDTPTAKLVLAYAGYSATTHAPKAAGEDGSRRRAGKVGPQAGDGAEKRKRALLDLAEVALGGAGADE